MSARSGDDELRCDRSRLLRYFQGSLFSLQNYRDEDVKLKNFYLDERGVWGGYKGIS